MNKNPLLLPTFTLAALLFTASPAPAADQAEMVRIPHEVREIEGWTVQVDTSLLEGKHKPSGDLALKVLEQRLHRIVMRLPEEPVARMREVPIYLDRAHPLGNAHYHPSAKWLERHGYDPAMARAIHITHARDLVRAAKTPRGGCVVLHELAHAYHDRVLGFDHKEILATYRKFGDTGKFDMVPYSNGRVRPHYGLTDHKEYFSEITEAFFTGNNIYPFNQLQLMEAHPESCRLVARIWGVKPSVSIEKDPGKLGHHDLRILATLKSQRGDHDEALEILGKAEEKSPGNERLAGERERIEAAKKEAEAE
ncbi:MAG: metallopeptidase [Akkermansiaceae bacterium]|nr:metallopeptidase [Akkermansiaceae bacterium]